MARIIVAFSQEHQCARVAGVLEESGIRVFRRCTTGAEVIREMNILQDGVLVCGTKFPDRTVDELHQDLGNLALMLIVGRPESLSLCEARSAFKLPLPATRDALASSVRMLLQLHGMRMPHRSEDERALVEQAKRLIMNAYGMSEKQAHQALQRISMKLGIKMTDSARRLLHGDDLFTGDPWKLTN